MDIGIFGVCIQCGQVGLAKNWKSFPSLRISEHSRMARRLKLRISNTNKWIQPFFSRSYFIFFGSYSLSVWIGFVRSTVDSVQFNQPIRLAYWLTFNMLKFMVHFQHFNNRFLFVFSSFWELLPFPSIERASNIFSVCNFQIQLLYNIIIDSLRS